MLPDLPYGAPEDEQDPYAMPGLPGAPLPKTTEPLGGGGAGTTLQALQPPEHSISTVGPTTTTHQRTAAGDQAVADLRAAHADAATAKRDLGDADIADAVTESDKADEAETLAQTMAARRAEVAARRAEEIAARKADYARRRQELEESSKITDLWEDKGGPGRGSAIARIMGAFAVGLAENAWTRAGGQGPSPLAQKVEAEIAADRQKKIDRFVRAKDFVAMAHEDVERAKDDLAEELKRLDDEAVVKRNLLAAKFEKQGKLLAIPRAQENARLAAAEMRAKNAESEAREENHLIASRTSGHKTEVWNDAKPSASKGPTESESKLALYSKQMQRDLDIIQKNPALTQSVLERVQSQKATADSADRSAGGGIVNAISVGAARKVGLIPRNKLEGLKPEEQKVFNAWEDATENFVRMKTGAGMPAEEAREAAFKNIPQPGDSKAVAAQKYQRLREAANEMATLGGAATQRLEAGRPQPPTAPSRPANDNGAEISEARKWLRSPDAKKNPQKAAKIMLRLRDLEAGR